jgi:exonuclease SbcD
MRILHTSDWHVGKRLGRHDRMDEHRAAMAEVARLAAEEQADLVLHSGDLFDRSMPPVDALQAGLQGLVGLTDGGSRPVVVVAGNHDSPDLFEALAPFLAGFGVHLIGGIKRPDDGGVVTVETGGGPAHIACFPFLRAARAVDFMDRADKWYGSYADRIRRICEVYAEAVADRRARGGVGLLVAHFMVGGVKVQVGVPRGERELHMGEAYTATAQAVPTSMDYVAMGHIHAPQAVPGAPVPAEYAGSLLQLDFGEAGEQKRVVMVDASPGRPAVVRSIPLVAGRPLVRASGVWEALAARTDLDDVWLDLAVDTKGPEPGLADLARERFPHLVKVQARYERAGAGEGVTEGMPLPELYSAYCEDRYGEAPGAELAAAFAELEEEALGASS